MMELAEKLGSWSRAEPAFGNGCFGCRDWPIFLADDRPSRGAHRNDIYHSAFGYARVFYYGR